MEIIKNHTCTNCENLLRGFICGVHNLKVEINNYCEKHKYKPSITNDSSCTNCNHFMKDSCTNPSEASNSMVCFDWEK